MARRFLLTLVVALAACAGKSGPQPTGVVNGGIAGHGVIVSDVASAQVTTATGSSAMIVLSTDGDVCGDAGSNVAHPGTASVTIELTVNTGTAALAPIGSGAYYVTATADDATPPENEAQVTASFLDASCAASGSNVVAGTSGTVTLTVVDDDAYQGQFDVTLATGDRITGDFESVACASLQTGSAAPACK